MIFVYKRREKRESGSCIRIRVGQIIYGYIYGESIIKEFFFSNTKEGKSIRIEWWKNCRMIRPYLNFFGFNIFR